MPTTLKNGNNQKAEKIRELGNLYGLPLLTLRLPAHS